MHLRPPGNKAIRTQGNFFSRNEKSHTLHAICSYDYVQNLEVNPKFLLGKKINEQSFLAREYFFEDSYHHFFKFIVANWRKFRENEEKKIVEPIHKGCMKKSRGSHAGWGKWPLTLELVSLTCRSIPESVKSRSQLHVADDDLIRLVHLNPCTHLKFSNFEEKLVKERLRFSFSWYLIILIDSMGQLIKYAIMRYRGNGNDKFVCRRTNKPESAVVV